ncbi:hypothetical protein CK203_108823 [Vitis vinifera]|uniref:Uncharacterized protein n=1 Tax=Vitis vinifera TaxID=29760 RepID=A0A438CE10_VITVI|nr:hypothetical protein CK203_108823 [Vitis vinifera]
MKCFWVSLVRYSHYYRSVVDGSKAGRLRRVCQRQEIRDDFGFSFLDHIPSVVMASKGFKPGGKTNPPSKPKAQKKRDDVAIAESTSPLLWPMLTSDILTKNITGRGIKRGGLYYMDDFSAGELTTCTTQPVTRRDKFSYCTVAWGTHHLAI